MDERTSEAHHQQRRVEHHTSGDHGLPSNPARMSEMRYHHVYIYVNTRVPATDACSPTLHIFTNH